MVGAFYRTHTSTAARARRVIGRLVRRVCFAIPFSLVVLSVSSAAGQGRLQDIRDGVRLPPPPASPSTREPQREAVDHHEPHRNHGRHGHNHWTLEAVVGAGYLAGLTVTSPFWGPYAIMDQPIAEGLTSEYFFPRFPYDHVSGGMIDGPWRVEESCGRSPGYMQIEPLLRNPRRWSARLRTEYASNLDDVQRIGGHLLLTTLSRWGLDTQMDYLREEFSDGTHDELWIGDCNVVFRFAHSEHMQWRTGLGFNWLDDPIRTDFGFNFTYGMDYFPGRPWVISSTLDWGTLGRAGLFRFRATTGALLNRFETYAGYEYLDVGATQIGSLIAGVRVWF